MKTEKNLEIRLSDGEIQSEENKMNSIRLNNLLIKEFPELKKSYESEVSWQESDATGAHVVYGDVLTPFLSQKIIAEDFEMTKRIFDFLEYLLSFGDTKTDELVVFSVLEGIAELANGKEPIINQMGSRTKRQLDEL